MKKGRIDVYKSIYPIELVVCDANVTIKQIQKLYSDPEGNELPDSLFELPGLTLNCIDKTTKRSCILVSIRQLDGNTAKERNIDLINSIAHEATHVTLETWYYIHESVSCETQEPLAYYTGWVAECIYKTVTNK